MPNSSLPLPSGRSADKVVSDIILRRNEARKWIDANYRDEWIEVYRALKCRTKPIPKLDSEGKPTAEEDKSRTNVEMGLLNLVWRKNVARLSARPYSLRVRGGEDPTVAPRFSSLLSKQYDRSKEALEDVRVRMSAESLGIGISKISWDYVYREMKFRKALMKDGKFLFKNRTALMKHQGAPDDEIQGAVAENGEDLNNDEIAAFLAKTGTETTVAEEVPKYEGPIVKFCFPGDVGWQPFVRSMNDSSFITHSYRETDLWLKNKINLTYKDPETGEDVKAFDADAVRELIRLDPEPTITKGEMVDLKDMFRQVSMKQTEEAYQFPRYLRVRKLYDIVEEHAQDDDGMMWITWVSEAYRDVPLGRMPYPVDFYGQSAFTDEVPLPDMNDSIGDSTPRLMRFLSSLYNIQTAQNFDYVTNTIKKIILAKSTINISPETMQFGNFLVQTVDDLNGIKEFQTSPLPPGAMERGAQILQIMGMFEPSMVGTGVGDEGNPLAGKLATTAILNAKSADSLLQFKIDGRDQYLYWLGMKKLWMNQQMADTTWTVEAKYFNKDLAALLPQGANPDKTPPEWALSDRMGKTSAIKLDPMEVQEDFEIEPETGSYMAVDDELKQAAAAQLGQAAMQAPTIFNQREVARFFVSTIRGIDNPDEFILPEPPPPDPDAPMKPDKFNLSANIGVALEKQLPAVQAQLLEKIGIQPPPALEDEEAAQTLERGSRMGDAASNLLTPEPQEQPEMPEPPEKPKSKTTFTIQSKKAGKNGNGTTQSFVHQSEGIDDGE